MAERTRVFVFGDQTYDFVPRLRELLCSRDNPLLTAFLEQSHYVIRAEMNQTLPPAERKSARTSNLPHLLHKYCDGLLNPAFQTALACVCQLGCFFEFVLTCSFTLEYMTYAYQSIWSSREILSQSRGHIRAWLVHWWPRSSSN